MTRRPAAPTGLSIGRDAYPTQFGRTTPGAQDADRSVAGCFDRRAFVGLAVATACAGPLALTGSRLAQAAPPTPPFRSDPHQLRGVSAELLPYYSAAAGPLVGNVPVDGDGIVVRVIAGKNYDHPVLQAQHMLHGLASYHINHDARYLSDVEAHAARIQSYAVMSGGAAYLPYPFPFNLHGKSSWTLPAPWYSGMAQGQALGAFSRLAKLTGEQKYADFADQLFASFSRIDDPEAPWAPTVDSDDALWFEEYPRPNGASCRALNGHIFAVYGLYDYWQLTQSAEAGRYVIGGMSAVAAHLETFRNPGWISHYCLTHLVTSTSYHRVHVGQLYQLFTYTGSSFFARQADLFLQDYPTAQAGGTAVLSAGNHQVWESSADQGDGGPVSVKLTTDETAACDSRAGLPGKTGVYLHITTGTLQGRWVKELPGKSFLRVLTEGYRFAYPRLLRFAAGTYTGHKFDANGDSAQQKPRRLNASSAAHVSQRLIGNGTLYYKVLDGIWAGWYMPNDDRMTLT